MSAALPLTRRGLLNCVVSVWASLCLTCSAQVQSGGIAAQPPSANGDPAPPKPAAPPPNLPPARSPRDDAYPQLELLTRAMQTIRQHFVDEAAVDYQPLVEGALEGMLRKLDPHSEYMGKALFEDLKREQADESQGIGIVISSRQGALSIVSVREDGPAARAGVLAGDQILQINEVLTQTLGVAEAAQLLEGRVGEPLQLVIRRPSTSKLQRVDLVREALSETSVADAMLLPPQLSGERAIGLVRVTQFAEATAESLAKALDQLESRGLQALVLDLRNNPGGLLESAVAVCGEFLAANTMVVSIEGRVAADNPPPYRTKGRNGKPARNYPLAVLINHGSASAAEIVAGALQDLGRAIVVGTTSFGKGSVQSIIPMSNGAAMRLTIAKYYTPSHRTIHGSGVTPNIIAALPAEQELKLARWRADHSSGEAAALELAALGDTQLERAVDALKGALIFKAMETPQPSPATPAIAPESKPAAQRNPSKAEPPLPSQPAAPLKVAPTPSLKP